MWVYNSSTIVEFKRFLKLLATAVNLKEIRAVATVLKSLGEFRKTWTLADAAELSSLLPLDAAPPQVLPPEIEKKYRLSSHRVRDYGNMPEIQTVLHLLHAMKLLDSHNDKEVYLTPSTYRHLTEWESL